jgi:Na+-translocating ferredoxin:NAD+ oxidoreductase RnfD subunit
MLDFILTVAGAILAIWFFATVYGGKGPNISDEDLDRISKGGPGE